MKKVELSELISLLYSVRHDLEISRDIADRVQITLDDSQRGYKFDTTDQNFYTIPRTTVTRPPMSYGGISYM